MTLALPSALVICQGTRVHLMGRSLRCAPSTWQYIANAGGCTEGSKALWDALSGVLQLAGAVVLQIPALHGRQVCNSGKVQVIAVCESSQLRWSSAITAAYDANRLRHISV